MFHNSKHVLKILFNKYSNSKINAESNAPKISIRKIPSRFSNPIASNPVPRQSCVFFSFLINILLFNVYTSGVFTLYFSQMPEIIPLSNIFLILKLKCYPKTIIRLNTLYLLVIKYICIFKVFLPWQNQIPLEKIWPH